MKTTPTTHRNAFSHMLTQQPSLPTGPADKNGFFPWNLLYYGVSSTVDTQTVEYGEAWRELSHVLESICRSDASAAISPIPLICFEGLPGAGKSTQIARVQAACEEVYGRGCFIDPPSGSVIGRLLRTLYADAALRNRMRRDTPWLTPLLFSADLRLAVRHAVEQGATYALVDRGILSTYFYNLAAYSEDFEEAWVAMQPHMVAFYRPTVTVFLDVDVQIAHERVVRRRRGELRKMDMPEQMLKDRTLLMNCQARLPEVPFCRIDGAQRQEEVTAEIMACLAGYLS